MDASALDQITTIMRIPVVAERILFVAVGVAGIAGVFFASTTRADAFEAANRQPKMTWVAILALSTLALLLRLPFIAWFAAVAVGIYYFDVRPQVKDIEGNSGGAW